MKAHNINSRMWNQQGLEHRLRHCGSTKLGMYYSITIFYHHMRRIATPPTRPPFFFVHPKAPCIRIHHYHSPSFSNIHHHQFHHTHIIGVSLDTNILERKSRSTAGDQFTFTRGDGAFFEQFLFVMNEIHGLGASDGLCDAGFIIISSWCLQGNVNLLANFRRLCSTCGRADL